MITETFSVAVKFTAIYRLITRKNSCKTLYVYVSWICTARKSVVLLARTSFASLTLVQIRCVAPEGFSNIVILRAKPEGSLLEFPQAS